MEQLEAEARKAAEFSARLRDTNGIMKQQQVTVCSTRFHRFA